jgi:hypothetical protein
VDRASRCGEGQVVTVRTRKAAGPVASVVVGPIELAVVSAGVVGRRFTVAGVVVQVIATNEKYDERAGRLTAAFHAVCSIPPEPPRIEQWGPGQFDRVTVAPGVEAWLRITPAGRVRMVVPGGDLDVTDGSAALGTGLHEAGARAAQIRVGLRERAMKRAEKLEHALEWHGAACTCTCCGAPGEICEDGRPRGAVFRQRCG